MAYFTIIVFLCSFVYHIVLSSTIIFITFLGDNRIIQCEHKPVDNVVSHCYVYVCMHEEQPDHQMKYKHCMIMAYCGNMNFINSGVIQIIEGVS